MNENFDQVPPPDSLHKSEGTESSAKKRKLTDKWLKKIDDEAKSLSKRSYDVVGKKSHYGDYWASEQLPAEVQEVNEKIIRDVLISMSDEYAERVVDRDPKSNWGNPNWIWENICENKLVHYMDFLQQAYGSLVEVKNKRILDLGCGNVTNGEGLNDKEFEPWFCRLLLKLGAEPVGVDMGNLEGEKFEHYNKNLVLDDALDFLPDKSFDGAHSAYLVSSPQLQSQMGHEERKVKRVTDNLKKQIKRLLKDDGKLFEFGEHN